MRAGVRAEAEKAKAQTYRGGLREYGRILGRTPSQCKSSFFGDVGGLRVQRERGSFSTRKGAGVVYTFVGKFLFFEVQCVRIGAGLDTAGVG